MRFLIFSDPHITRSCEFRRPTEDGLNEYLHILLESFAFVKNTILEERPDALVFCGDLFEDRDYVDSIALNVGFRAIRELSTFKIHKFAIVGNHDYWSVEHQIHSLEFLRGFGWHVFDEPGIVSLERTRILGIPYRDSYKENLGPFVLEGADVAFSHVDVVGGRLRVPKSDTDFKAYSSSGVDPKQLSKAAEMVFNGHYHHPSIIGNNIVNVGALASRTFSDKGSDPRRIILYDSLSQVVRSIPNPYAKAFEEYFIYSPEDVEKLVIRDTESIYARVRYSRHLEDEVQLLNGVFAGSRFIPIKERDIREKEPEIDLEFSMEENLERYIKDVHDGDSELLKLALEIFKLAVTSEECSAARDPIEFGRLVIINFQSIAYLDIDLRGGGLTLIKGINDDDSGQLSNGSGKSSLIEAIYWCLKGKSLRGYKVSEVVNWDETGCMVALEQYSGEEIYTQIRSRKDIDWGTGVKLFNKPYDDCDPEEKSIGARLASDTETKVADLIARSENNLKHTCFMVRGSASRFTELSKSQRANILEEIIDNRPFEVAQGVAKKRYKVTHDELSVLQGKLESCTERKEEGETRIEDLEGRIETYQETSKVALNNYDKLKIKLDKIVVDSGGKLEESIVNIKIMQDDISILETKSTILKELKKRGRADLGRLNEEYAILEEKMERCERMLMLDLCPECDEPINPQRFENISGLTQLSLKKLEVTIKMKREKLEQQETRADTFEEALRKKNKVLLARFSAKSSIEMAIQEAKEGLKEVEHSRKSVLTGEDTLRGQLKKEMESLETVQSTLYNLLETETELSDLHQLLLVLYKEVFDEQGVRGSVLAEVGVPYINSRLGVHLALLQPGREITLEDDLEMTLDGKRSYTGNSSGERGRVDLAMQFSVNDLSVATGRSRIDFLALDEILDQLDDLGLETVVKALEERARSSRILLVSHAKHAAAIISHQWILVKDEPVPPNVYGRTSLLKDISLPNLTRA